MSWPSSTAWGWRARPAPRPAVGQPLRLTSTMPFMTAKPNSAIAPFIERSQSVVMRWGWVLMGTALLVGVPVAQDSRAA